MQKIVILAKKKSFKTAAYQLDTYILFIEKSINLLKENGFLGFIMPNSWLSNLLFIKIRKFLLDNTKIIEIVETKDKIFGSANVDVVVLIIQKNKNNQNNRIQKGTFTHGNYEKNYLIPQTEFNKDDLVFNINISAIGRDLIKKIDKNSIRIKNILDVSTGIKEYQVGKGIPSQTQKDKDELKFHADFKKDKTYLSEIRGKNIGRYTLNWNNEYVSYGKWVAEPRTPKYFSGERILVRKIPGINNLVISYTNEDFVIDQSIYIGIIKNKKFNLKYILAILNSRLIGWYFKNKHNEFDNLFPQIKVTQFKDLSIYPANKKQQKEIAILADKILKLNKQFQSTPENSDKWNEIKKEIGKVDGEIDENVFEIYGLREEEIEVVKNLK